ncbi:hypothetical protein HFE03_25835 [Paenibacillus sp. EKM102P]|nr:MULTISPECIES: hypothetical protein [unclassified Paenibacillus]KAF6614221.1 hypothetical protein HFE00_25865 [Paenibacillus sp. EKM101P]KAF6616579.1 hypothetical protein HFE03_25835 [Paenibacillus sp. EKM102P]KAF6625047.1 hypothetical protein HFE01_26055 [Paenibacillus sp. EKM10P]KAF6640871.1 hypothetical protein HFE02_25850 [Paenibacillus sp. EKM11P]
MEGSVFSYFFAIGSGLALGIAWVTVLSFWIFNKMKNKGAAKNAIVRK